MAALIHQKQNKLWGQMLQRGIYGLQTHGLDKLTLSKSIFKSIFRKKNV